MHWLKSVAEYFDWLEDAMADIAAGTIDIVFYQAGADPHRDDPLGGLLNNEELAERDRLVFDLYREHHVPIAWNLAGGNQRDDNGSIEPVIAIHRATLLAAKFVV